MKKRRETTARRQNRNSIKTEPKVIVNIHPGPASPAQRAAWKRFWAKLITEVKDEANKVS